MLSSPENFVLFYYYLIFFILLVILASYKNEKYCLVLFSDAKWAYES